MSKIAVMIAGLGVALVVAVTGTHGIVYSATCPVAYGMACFQGQQ